jgi:hypothetical protein
MVVTDIIMGRRVTAQDRAVMFRLVCRPRYMRARLNDAKAIVNGEL